MDIKEILKAPGNAIARHLAITGQALDAQAVAHRVEQITRLRQAGKQIRQEKQQCSRQFKSANGDENTITSLKNQMQCISQQLARLTSEQQDAEKQLLELFQGAPSDTASAAEGNSVLPTQFWPALDRNNGRSRIDIIAVDDSFEEKWDQYITGHAQASLYHHYKWRAVITKSFGHQSFYLAAFDDAKDIVGVLPLIWLNSRLFGSFAVSMPFFNYGGPLSDSAYVTQALLDHAQTLIAQYQWNHTEIRTTQAGLNLPSQSRKVSMIRRLPEHSAELDQDIGAKVRAQINQGNRHCPEVLFGKEELLDDFYKVFSIHMRDLGTPVYGKTFFENILRAFPDEATLVSVRIKNRPVATAFLIGHRDMLEIPWASTLRKVNKLNINMWMYRQILGYAIAKGYRFFDFGRSTVDASTYRFKKQWGAIPVEHYWYYAMASNQSLPELNPDNPKYKLLIAVWKKLPITVSNIIGPMVVKHLP